MLQTALLAICFLQVVQTRKKLTANVMIGLYVSKLLSLLLGFLYPAYRSFKALNTKAENDDVQVRNI